MTIIKKACINTAMAERHQQRLYNLYNYVRLIDYPKYSSAGLYKWEVKDKIKKKVN